MGGVGRRTACGIAVVMIMMIMMIMAIAAAARGDYVERRGAEPRMEGQVVGIDDAGVHVRSDLGAMHTLSWDRVRAVRMEVDDPTLPDRLARAEALWRARTRAERGDYGLAEVLFERLFERFRGQTHETALVVAEGLLRCRLARGANADALVPALETARIRRAGVETNAFTMLPPVVDEQTALCPEIGPVWISSRALVKLERDLAAYDASGDVTMAEIARLYRRAVLIELGSDEPVPAEDAGEAEHPGVRLLRLIVATAAPDRAQRAAARGRLQRALDDLPPWADGWARFALGVSLLRDGDLASRQRATVSLLHLPALFRSELPYLSGLALAWVREISRAEGDAETAEFARQELARSYPNHPLHRLPEPVVLPAVEDADP